MIRKIDRWVLALSYVLLVASVFTIGWITEEDSTQTQERQCAIFRAQILVNTELAQYTRSILEGVTVPELDPLDGDDEEIVPYFIESSSSIYVTPEAGGHYVLGGDMTLGDAIMFTVTHPDVASVDVMLGSAWVSAIQITTEDPQGLLCSATTPFPENKNVNFVREGPPTLGTYTVGRIVYNETPATGQPMGWMCTVAGTPGTWKAMANLA